MTDFPGFLSNELLEIGAGVVVNKPLQLPVEAENPGGLLSAFIQSRPRAGVIIDHLGFILENFGDGAIYGRIWASPLLIDAGFIADDLIYNISIWNAHEDSSKQITAINPVDPGGTSLSYSGTLPKTLPPTGEDVHVLTVLREGPVEQDSSYEYTVNSLLFVVEITGTRVVLFPFEPNWKDGVEVSFLLQTVTFSNNKLTEQRRQLLPRLFREESFKVLFERIKGQALLNTLSFAQDKIVGVPIYTEPLTTQTNLSGASLVVITEPLDFLYNLQTLTEFIVFIDEETQEAEAKKIDSIVGQNITLATALDGSFDKDKTVIYPLMLATFEQVPLVNVTDRVLESSLVFQELILVG